MQLKDPPLGTTITGNEKKTRTRGHIIADMSLHYFGYRVVRCGYTFQHTTADYGYDGAIHTFNENGEVENAQIFVQLKASDKIKRSADGSTIRFRIERKDIRLWQDEPFPVYLVVFDAKTERAYWLYLQRYFQTNAIKAATMQGNSMTVGISVKRVLNASTMRGWREHKQALLKKLGAVSHA